MISQRYTAKPVTLYTPDGEEYGCFSFETYVSCLKLFLFPYRTTTKYIFGSPKKIFSGTLRSVE